MCKEVRLFYLNNVKYFNSKIIRTHAVEFKLVFNKAKEIKVKRARTKSTVNGEIYFEE